MSIAALSALWSPGSSAEVVPRERMLLDAGWRFHLGDDWGIARNLAKAGSGIGPASWVYSDASWRQVNLPHDWAIELPFDSRADGSHGFKALGEGFSQNNVGWYRRNMDLTADVAGKRIWLEFEGVFRDCTVYVNGWFVGRHESGYSGFRYDITDLVDCGGRNVVAVRVDASQFEGWFYEGAGIYRHVWLVATSPLAVAPDGVFVHSRFSRNVPEGPAELSLQTDLLNKGAATSASVDWEVLGPDGRSVATAHQAVSVGGNSQITVEATARVAAPVLWSPDAPALYRLVTTVSRVGKTADRVETEFGIRTVGFDAGKGSLLNGRPFVLKGTCNHQDHAGVGVALPDRLQYYRIARLKEMGANAYRTSHNPPTPELLTACDRLGMLVMDESRLLGSDVANLTQLTELVRRDRNHPSVAIWSLGNEEYLVHTAASGGRVASTMQSLVKQLDPTRPVTYNANVDDEFAGVNSVIEVRGWSYHIGPATDAYHREHPGQPNVGSEQGSTVGTRGIYANDPDRGYVSAYDDNAPPWADTARKWWSFVAARPWLSGGFVWTGFDYRGEPTPYGWPCINSHFGIMDTCGFPKDNYWYYQSWWTDRPVLHLLPHWNWPGREGQEINVQTLSNCEEVELFLNGRNLGRKQMQPNSALKWMVPYEPGALAAKGYRRGALVAEDRVETTGAPAAIRLMPDRFSIQADGEDVSVVTVSVVDTQGRVVPVAGNSIQFSLAGPGRILGVGNGDPSCHEPDQYFAEPTIRIAPIENWRWQKVASIYNGKLPEEAADYDDSRWASLDTGAESGPLTPDQHGVFRAHFTVSAANLAQEGLELWFGRINGTDLLIYINGRWIGAVDRLQADRHAPSVFEIARYVHPGENVVAVALSSYGAIGGLNRGVKLRYIEAPAPVVWRRSVFNGLAQIIVQSTPDSGTLRLTASAGGLEPATIAVETRPAPLRPSEP